MPYLPDLVDEPTTDVFEFSGALAALTLTARGSSTLVGLESVRRELRESIFHAIAFSRDDFLHMLLEYDSYPPHLVEGERLVRYIEQLRDATSEATVRAVQYALAARVQADADAQRARQQSQQQSPSTQYGTLRVNPYYDPPPPPPTERASSPSTSSVTAARLRQLASEGAPPLV